MVHTKEKPKQRNPFDYPKHIQFTLCTDPPFAGKTLSQAKICSHYGDIRHLTQLHLHAHKFQRTALKRNRHAKAINALSRPRLYPRIADRAKGELGSK